MTFSCLNAIGKKDFRSKGGRFLHPYGMSGKSVLAASTVNSIYMDQANSVLNLDIASKVISKMEKGMVLAGNDIQTVNPSRENGRMGGVKGYLNMHLLMAAMKLESIAQLVVKQKYTNTTAKRESTSKM